jgi:1-acyl-sn-glycerol-3-phosphate acyltransferase
MLRTFFYWLIVKPLMMIILGIHARGRECLPVKGPAIIVANHNSHLDTLALMSLFPTESLANVHPVAAADYFLANRWLSWFALEVMGIIPIDRSVSAGREALKPVFDVLGKQKILIFYPEGTRGEPESLGKMKKGIAYIVGERPEIPVIPVFFHGLGKSLPKGEIILVPFFIDAFIGEPLHWSGNRHDFMAALNGSMADLQAKANKQQVGSIT